MCPGGWCVCCGWEGKRSACGVQRQHQCLLGRQRILGAQRRVCECAVEWAPAAGGKGHAELTVVQVANAVKVGCQSIACVLHHVCAGPQLLLLAARIGNA